jgi:hypothetical protein
MLLEKPIEQSRERVKAVLELSSEHKLDIRCNHYLRTLSLFKDLKHEPWPKYISVHTGAFGLGCNGIHWLDAAVYMTNSDSADMLFGEIDAEPILSGRGSHFRDYGGRAIFALSKGSRLYVSVSSNSSAPTVVSIVLPHAHIVLDIEADSVVQYRRDPSSTKPNYLYGADYQRDEWCHRTSIELWKLTDQWTRYIQEEGPCSLPSLEETWTANKMLFDLLERTGLNTFPIT